MAVHFYLVKHHGVSSVPGHEESRPGELTDTEVAIRSEGFEPFSNHLVHILGWGLVLTALGSFLALVVAAPLGGVIEPGEEKTKPPWLFLPVYPFEDWIGIKALLWLPIVGVATLVVVPFIDRFGSSSVRRRWVLTLGAVLVIAALVALGIYAQASTPAEHVPGMEGE
jgi:quinol-cytochrome oxidoreductase complex cytochrome b subunit